MEITPFRTLNIYIKWIARNTWDTVMTRKRRGKTCLIITRTVCDRRY
jgi:hypothetical protein